MELRIAQYRKKRGMTQEQLAARLGIGRSTLAQYETGAAEIRVSMLPTLAHALNISVTQLLGEDQEEPAHVPE